MKEAVQKILLPDTSEGAQYAFTLNPITHFQIRINTVQGRQTITPAFPHLPIFYTEVPPISAI